MCLEGPVADLGGVLFLGNKIQRSVCMLRACYHSISLRNTIAFMEI